MSLIPSPGLIAGQSIRFTDSELAYLGHAERTGEKRILLKEVLEHPYALSLTANQLYSLIDFGVGESTILSGATKQLITNAKALHGVKLRIVAKEFSFANVKNSLPKIAEFLDQYPDLCVTITNLPYNYATDVTLFDNKKRPQKHEWLDLKLNNVETAEQQIMKWEGDLQNNWDLVKVDGRDVPANQAVVNIYRADAKERLGGLIPQRKGGIMAGFQGHNVGFAFHPYDRNSKIKHSTVMAPLMKSLVPGGIIFGAHVAGRDDAEAIVDQAHPWFKETRRYDTGQSIFNDVIKSLDPTLAAQFRFLESRGLVIRYQPDAITDETVKEAYASAIYSEMVNPKVTDSYKQALEITKRHLEEYGVLKMQNEFFTIKRLIMPTAVPAVG